MICLPPVMFSTMATAAPLSSAETAKIKKKGQGEITQSQLINELTFKVNWVFAGLMSPSDTITLYSGKAYSKDDLVQKLQEYRDGLVEISDEIKTAKTQATAFSERVVIKQLKKFCKVKMAEFDGVLKKALVK